jgi:nitroreductase
MRVYLVDSARQIEARSTPLSDSFFERIVRAASLAPSGDNLQPWSFTLENDSLLIKHDRTRDHSLFNVRQLASYIALGAAIENIRITAAGMHHRVKIDYFPYGNDHEVVGRASFDAGGEPGPLEAALEQRCTNRRPYTGEAIKPEILSSLYSADDFPRVRLFWVNDRAMLDKLSRLSSHAERLIFDNPRIHNHLFSTIRWNQREVERTRDGLPIKSLELGGFGAKAFRLLKSWPLVRSLNKFGLSKAAAVAGAKLMRQCSAAGLITVPDPSPSSFLEAGSAFQHIWLSATKEALALQPMTALIFLQLKSRLGEYSGLAKGEIDLVDRLRNELKEFFELSTEEVPAMLFRLGYASPPSARTIRRNASISAKKNQLNNG